MIYLYTLVSRIVPSNSFICAMLNSFKLCYSTLKILVNGGARGVMVIVVGSSNLGRDWLHFT